MWKRRNDYRRLQEALDDQAIRRGSSVDWREAPPLLPIREAHAVIRALATLRRRLFA